MSHQPFFSVVIPTRNRAHLLRQALQSVRGQTFDDYELVVSDNCSHDDTAEVVREIGDSRVRYVRPDRSLSMPDHWEFALEHARGQFVTYLCDDDAYAPGALARVSKLLAESQSRLVVLYSGYYYAPNWTDPTMRNVADFYPRYTGAVREHRSSDGIRHLYESCRGLLEIPRMLNSFYHRETLMRVRAEAGRIFLLCPDYSFAVIAPTAVPSWLFIDEPFHLSGLVPESVGASQVHNRGEAAQEFEREFKQEELLQHVPLKLSLVSNLITETLLRSKEIFPKLAEYNVDWIQYFASCWNDILFLEQQGVDVSADKEEYLRVLETQPAGLRERISVVVTCPPDSDPGEEWGRRHPFRASVRKVINNSARLTNLESLVRGRSRGLQVPRGSHTYVPGAAAGFNNILECARQLPALARAAAVTQPLSAATERALGKPGEAQTATGRLPS
jgi:glycosyltransferase involved in cell wall biosynthesis